MIGDIINIKPEYFKTAQSIINLINEQGIIDSVGRQVIAIGGESGSGKSVTAMCLQKVLHEQGITSMVLHQDDYFKLPPANNHNVRLQDISKVGIEEVNMDILQANVHDYLSRVAEIVKPIVNYKANIILEEIVQLKDVDVLIIEGTYVLALQNISYKVFMERTYLQTLLQRRERARDTQDLEFIEQVLAIEHKIIAAMKSTAHALVATDYSVTKNNI